LSLPAERLRPRAEAFILLRGRIPRVPSRPAGRAAPLLPLL